MRIVRHTQRSLILAGALLLLGVSGQVQARSPVPMDDVPDVQWPPVVITTYTPPPVFITNVPPGGTTQSAPEPATLLSGLLGAALLGLCGRRRRRNGSEHAGDTEREETVSP
jgi:hypothetical protein